MNSRDRAIVLLEQLIGTPPGYSNPVAEAFVDAIISAATQELENQQYEDLAETDEMGDWKIYIFRHKIDVIFVTAYYIKNGKINEF